MLYLQFVPCAAEVFITKIGQQTESSAKRLNISESNTPHRYKIGQSSSECRIHESAAKEHESRTFSVVLTRRYSSVRRSFPVCCPIFVIKYFSGTGDELKEYSIAIDVLGRMPSLIPNLMPCSVDTFHLRKRLKQYYASEGNNHRFRLFIRPGHTSGIRREHGIRRFQNETPTLTADGSEENTSVSREQPGKTNVLDNKMAVACCGIGCRCSAAWQLTP